MREAPMNTISDVVVCNHLALDGRTCWIKAGHDGYHQTLELGPVTEAGESTFCLYQWGDEGTPRPLPEEQGSEFPIRYDANADEKRRIVSFCKMEASKVLPKGWVYEIRTHSIPGDDKPSDYRRRILTKQEQIAEWGICWCTLIPQNGEPPILEQEPLFENDVTDLVPITKWDYCLLARIKV